LVVVVGMLAVIFLAGVLLGGSAAEFASRVPYYEQRLQALTNTVLGHLGAGEEMVSIRELLKEVDPGSAWGLATSLLNTLSALFGDATLIVFTMIFILLEAAVLPDKIAAAAGGPGRSQRHLQRFISNLNRYLRIKTTTSAATGLIIWAWLSFLGVDFPVLWGLLAFLLNFIPTIGSIIAAIPAVLLALVQHGPGLSLTAAAGYLVVNIIIGNLIEPRVTGQGLGLSTLVVFLSLVFWGWLWGPVGMFLSVPLTMILKIGMENSRDLKPIAMMLDSPRAAAERLRAAAENED
jgi:predicted PurR-regulated permease PerM